MDNLITLIKELRDKTNAGITDCKKALLISNGDIEQAMTYLRTKGLASANTKQKRITKQGVIASYIHTGSQLGVLLELNCETDFVAKRKEFIDLAQLLALQIAANQDINFISIKDIPQNIIDKEYEIESQRDDLKKKPNNVRENIIKGRVNTILKNYVLFEQICIRNSEISVEEYIKNHIALLGENIQVNRFIRFVIGN